MGDDELMKALNRFTGARRYRGTYNLGPDCRVCGYKRINVRHDSDNALEGRAYFDEIVPDRHEFTTAAMTGATDRLEEAMG